MTSPIAATAERGWMAARCRANASASRWRSWTAAALSESSRRARSASAAPHTRRARPPGPPRPPAPPPPPPLQRRARTRAAPQRRAQQARPPPPLHVRARPDPEQVQRHQLGRLPQRLGALLAEPIRHRRPDRAEHLVTRAHGDGDPRQRVTVLPVGDGSDEDRLVAAEQLAEDPAFAEDPRKPFRHLSAEDGLDP